MASVLSDRMNTSLWRTAVKKHALPCRKCLKMPFVLIERSLLALKNKVAFDCDCGRFALESDLDVKDLAEKLISKWNKENTPGINSPTNTKGLIQ